MGAFREGAIRNLGSEDSIFSFARRLEETAMKRGTNPALIRHMLDILSERYDLLGDHEGMERVKRMGERLAKGDRVSGADLGVFTPAFITPEALARNAESCIALMRELNALLWTGLTFYPNLARSAFERLLRSDESPNHNGPETISQNIRAARH